MENDPFHSSVQYADPKVRDALVHAYLNRNRQCGRVRIWLGDPETGKCWNEAYDVAGYVGRSTGEKKVPLLLHDKRSMGGGAILTQNIIRVDWTDGTGTIYKHPKFHTNLESATLRRGGVNEDCAWWVLNNDGETMAGFPSEYRARNWLAFMLGKRYRK